MGMFDDIKVDRSLFDPPLPELCDATFQTKSLDCPLNYTGEIVFYTFWDSRPRRTANSAGFGAGWLEFIDGEMIHLKERDRTPPGDDAGELIER